jgi:NAD(P)-dependent dehydrogenase (short-subunit alcohol dehydrogenase family)
MNGELMSLEGKTLFITGASRGIGLVIGLRAAREGANVAIAAKTETLSIWIPLRAKLQMTLICSL